jgi:hypothetical protein
MSQHTVLGMPASIDTGHHRSLSFLAIKLAWAIMPQEFRKNLTALPFRAKVRSCSRDSSAQSKKSFAGIRLEAPSMLKDKIASGS